MSDPSTTDAALIRSAMDAGVPHHLIKGLVGHIMRGVPTGGFLRAVLDNDLREAVACADDVSRAALANVVRFLHSEAPSPAWGCPENVEAWKARGGLQGLPAEAAS